MSETPKTDAWKLEVCGQGSSAYLAWPNSVWEGIESLERENINLKQENKILIEELKEARAEHGRFGVGA